jgi:predicted  nucleic acid-binding Zn-ribbon protein
MEIMDRQLEKNVDYAKYGIDALVAEIIRLEEEVDRLENIVSEKESRIEDLENLVIEIQEQQE